MRPPREGGAPPFHYNNEKEGEETNAEAAKAILLEAVSAAATAAAAAALAKDAATPITDMRGTIEQRRQLVEVLTGRMIKQAVERARG